jgi:hypothetical protein
MNHLYAKYSNVEEVDNMFHDESLDLITDKLYDKIEDLESVIAEKDDVIAEKDNIIASLQEQIKNLQSVQ